MWAANATVCITPTVHTIPYHTISYHSAGLLSKQEVSWLICYSVTCARGLQSCAQIVPTFSSWFRPDFSRYFAFRPILSVLGNIPRWVCCKSTISFTDSCRTVT
ncbi:hypothetical protein, unlikely [Trypanosoma brucei gambiense DAL972]|uniref:Uncharacterized protein n=1 Tax=Trypanosoma brucei gambiense (strain MHOM/CI/86/DAL972) TaxID=679716 RepID=C9ZNH1_TRYB9|nr:hypothetical protein, unlikely [Trypanosoma brucei gambiense DAL972]CBH10949.1 hypothetical protein, unlikely [Trypanosoma brucei gambiense DAL972]|eukprot:XP_011773236.1 hypothetical protein, unlikely [Trypanosoma brucei gambiense DAL972]